MANSTVPLRVGLIGTGSVSRLHLRGYLRFPEIVQPAAVFDVNPDAAAAAASAAGGVQVFTNIADLLANAQIDAVDIATPHDQHAQLAVAAAQAGKHVFLEKPMAVSMAECRAIIEAAEQAGVTLMIGQHFRHVPSYRGVKRLVETGRLGRVWAGRIDEFLPTNIDRTPSRPGRWYNDKLRAGGGVVITQSTHHIDLFRFFFGDVRRVSASYWTDHPAYANGAEDSAVATLEFENGLIAHLCASNSTRTPHFFQFSLLGTEGSVWTSVAEGTDAVQRHQAPAFMSLSGDASASRTGVFAPPAFLPVPVPEADLPCEEPFANEIVHFVRCCQEGTEPTSSGRDNLGTKKAIFGIYASAEAGGEWVNMSDL